MQENKTGEIARFARTPSTRVTKWLVVGFWILVLGLVFGPASKLPDALNNEAASWLPQDAQSTQVADQIADFQSKNEFPAPTTHPRAYAVAPSGTAYALGVLPEAEPVDRGE